MKKKAFTKKAALRIHTKKRAKERYEIDLFRKDIDNIVTKIQSRNALFVNRESGRVSKWLVEYNEKLLCVIYDRKRKTLVTCLPAEPWMRDLYYNRESDNPL